MSISKSHLVLMSILVATPASVSAQASFMFSCDIFNKIKKLIIINESIKSFGQCLMINLRIIPNIDMTSCFGAIKSCTVSLGETTVVFKIDLGLILRRGYVSDAALVLAHVHFLKISGLPRQLSHFFLPVIKRGHLFQILIVDIHGRTLFSHQVIFKFFAKSFPIKFVYCVRVPKS